MPYKNKNTPGSERREILRALSFMSQIGIILGACVFIGVFLGNFLDKIFGTSPWLLLVCSLFGVGAAIKSLYDLGKRSIL
jgi:ATP synthase protein I